jgi:hypothetical protein
MKFELIQHGKKYSIEMDEEDQTLEEMCELFKQLLLCAGYIFSGEVVIDEPDTGDNIQGD